MTTSRQRRAFFIHALALMTAGPVLARAEKSATNDPLTVEVSGIVLPLANGQALVSYLFATVTIQLRDASSALYLRENQFLLKDALVRMGSRAPIQVGQRPNTYDQNGVIALVTRAVQVIRPATQLVRVAVMQGEFMRK